MTDNRPTSFRTRRHLFLGGAAGALACALATMPVQAQTTDIRATAAQSLVNSQANQGADVVTDAGNTRLTTVIAGSADAASLSLSGNEVTITARGNRAGQDLEPDAPDTAGAFGRAALTAGATRVTGNAGMLIANRQSNKAAETVANTDSATGMDSAIAIDAGQVTGSQLTTSDNAQEALALGNDATATLATIGGTGAGIVSAQTDDALSGVAARSFGSVGITAQDVSASNLAVTGNLERGIAYGNAVDNALTANPTAIEAPASGEIASTVPAIGSGDPTTNAIFAILSNQSDAGVVKARAGSGTGFASGLAATGDVDASSLTNDANSLVAAGYGNQSSNDLAIDTVSVSRAGEGSTGAVANVTGVQSLGDTSRIIATTTPGAITQIFGDATGSSLSVSGNTAQTIATGNLASGNLLTVKANTIDATRGDAPGGGAAGTAITTQAGDGSTSAAFNVQNVQDYGKASISAASIGDAADIEIDGTVTGSELVTDGNIERAAATGNSVHNAATLDATRVATSADVNNIQTGAGNVSVTLDDTQPAGTTVSPMGEVSNSQASVTSNSVTGTAIANTSSNSLAIAADTLLDGSGHRDAEAGPIADGYGAAATFALANEQKTGGPSNDDSTPAISADITGRFAIDGDGRNDQSSLAVDDNLQYAGALANDTVNRLSIAATGQGDDGAPAAGSALSSSQYGQANVSAASDAKFIARGAMSNSSASLSHDSNEAVATINQADNGLSVDSIQTGSVAGGDDTVSTGPFGPPSATGDHVLANQQFATGSARAAANSRFLNGDVGSGVQASRFTIADDITSADASANRALNAVSVTAAGPAGSAGLVNTQMSAAGVTASATTGAAFSVVGAPLVPVISDTDISIDGNQTNALARGNAADNQLNLGSTSSPGASADGMIGRYDATVDAAAALLNSQANYGAVTATASNSGYGVPLNADGAINASSLGVAGNSVSAAAYGNVASNAVSALAPGRLPTAAIANIQTNYGPVTAQVTGASFRAASGALSAASLSITGNQLAATATGNQATNIIAAQR